ncbi:hypothetical protein Pcinc_014343 [Petrolisthes cinctipes]|uniref:Uncharacterized protein n=1 Tax=Petrolisthes cinctipes TaxID=88211 RepID=A0AAE1KQS9_PETCI|nr:hypothetical protein Pcinc_014343 [Petrolisthes cinctipes]
MSLFDLEAFVKSPTIEVLSDIRKQDWLDIANSYKIPCNGRAKKEVIKNIVVEGLVTLEVLPADAIDVLTPGTSSGDKTPKSSLLSHFNLQTHPPGEETRTPPEKEKLAHGESPTDQRTSPQFQLNYDIQLRRLQMEREIAQQKLEMEERRAERNAQQKLEMEKQKLEMEERRAQQMMEKELDLRFREVKLKEEQRNRGRPNCREYFCGEDNES